MSRSKKKVSPGNTLHPVILLADAIYDVEMKASEWKVMADALGMMRRGAERLCQPLCREDEREARQGSIDSKEELLAKINVAVSLIFGVDQYVRDPAGTPPGRWTTELMSSLTAFRSAIRQNGDHLAVRADSREWVAVLGELHERQRFLRNIDLSIFEGGANFLNAAKSREIPWTNLTPEYITASDALRIAEPLTDGLGLNPTKLSRLCIPDGPFRYMHKGQRCKIHAADFMAWIKSQSGKTITDEAIEQYLNGVEKRKAEIHQRKIRRH
jgi:hypothetical protein